MNDRFLFRAKRVDNGEWAIGHYQRRFDLIGNEEHYIFFAKSHNEWEYAEIEPSTICQCTGLRDMPGNRIWENDIVTYGNHKGIVKFGLYDSKHLGLFIEWMKGYGREYLRKDFPYWVLEIKVVGNVFDNPELLEVE